MKSIALAGNPNSGKTSLFNTLTGSKQHVGNWPGVTVEKKEGILKYKGIDYKIIDLPGTYSLGAYSEDEIIGRNYILSGESDVVINVIDSTNIERNLYLTLQLLEMNIKVILALNMMDLAKNKNIFIDKKKLSKELGIPVVETIALNSNWVKDLIEEAVKENINGNPLDISYGENIEKELEIISEKIDINLVSKRWLALKLIENDSYIEEITKVSENKDLKNTIESAKKRIEEKLGFEGEMEVVNKRYDIISNIISKAVKREEETESLSDKIDKIVTNKYLGLPIFAGVMFILYQLTFFIGAGLQEFVDETISQIGERVAEYLGTLNAPEIFTNIFVDGVFGGVGAVLSFLPLIMTMYLLIGLLEDSGYMARAAYVMDRLMRKLGLHGKTFVSMLVSVGCNVPGIMATRTLDNKKDRMIAILINPFVSCGARLPIYALFISAFFEKNRGLILFSIYALGIIMALIMGKLFSKTLFKGEPSYFVMELPNYKIPSIKNVLLLMWDKAGAFLKKAGVVILPMMIVLAFLSNFPISIEGSEVDSLLGLIGSFIAPIFAPAGFGTWQASIALITGILAKETVVGTMGLTYAGVEEGATVVTAIQGAFTPLSAMSFMVMSLLYTPCLVALGAIKRETNSWRWTLFAGGYTFLIAWIMSVLIYQIGSLLGY
ncbi:ferrous iron transport protein B [Clostridium thermobutyricum]|uniref:ferrous iron transport protein B n=1 Tax=Clostridium thermobutyricum TaxID=29372 RepID=UPI0018AA6DBB|nr:ferrous iron transport protein B [Clostridium thermobutyricum]